MKVTTGFGTVKILMLKGEQGEAGADGANGYFEDLTEEQLEDLKSDIRAYYKKVEGTYTTTEASEQTIPINVTGYTSADVLTVNIEGLDLVEGVDYTISGNNIILSTAITHTGTRVNFCALRSFAVATSDYDTLKAEEEHRAYATVADMQDDENLTNGMIVRTAGFHSVGDGGAALYQISATGTANGMDVLALDNGLYALLIVDDEINVKQNGAHGDNTADDTSILQYCLAQANTRGINLYIPAGNYVVSDEIGTITNCPRVYGANNGMVVNSTVIKDTRNSSVSDYLITVQYSSIIGGAISNIAFVTSSAVNCIKILVNAKWDYLLRDLTIRGYSETAIYTNGSDNNFDNVQIFSCGQDGYAVYFGSSANAHRFTNCHIEHCKYAIYIDGYGHSFTNLKVEQSSWGSDAPIKSNSSYSYDQNIASFIGCFFVGLDMDSYPNLNSDYSNVPYFMNVGACIVDGCQFANGTGSGSTSITTYGEVKFINAVRCVISNNVFIRASYSEPTISAEYSTISGNRFTLYSKSSPFILISDYLLIKIDTYSTCQNNEVNSNKNSPIQICNFFSNTNKIYATSYRFSNLTPSGTVTTYVIKPAVITTQIRMRINKRNGAINSSLSFTTASSTIGNTNIIGRHNNTIYISVKDSIIYVQMPGSAQYCYFENEGEETHIYQDVSIQSYLSSSDVDVQVTL